MEDNFEIKDSGKRRSFDSGAKRDVDYDKPRFDLIPMTALRKIVDYNPGRRFLDLELDGDDKARMWNLGLLWGATIKDDLLLDIVWMVLDAIRRQEGDDELLTSTKHYSGLHVISPKTYLRIANHYSGGAKKYDPWNWSKGMPLSVFHASLMRHIFKIIINETDEDHLSAIFFNVAAILHFQIIGREDLDDVTPRLTEWFPSRIIG